MDSFDALASHYPISVYLLVSKCREAINSEIIKYEPLDNAPPFTLDLHKKLSKGRRLIENHAEKLRDSWPSNIQIVFNMLTALGHSLATMMDELIKAWKSEEVLVVNEELPLEMHRDEA